MRYNSMRPSIGDERGNGEESVFPWYYCEYTLPEENVQILNLYNPHSKEITWLTLYYYASKKSYDSETSEKTSEEKNSEKTSIK